MNATTATPIFKTKRSRLAGYDFDNIEFGTSHTDHIFMAEYNNGEWNNQRIEPFGNFTLSPFALCFHYGQTVFEGLKAYRLIDGRISIFRPEQHYRRMNRSLERMCMPSLPEEMFMEGLEQLIRLEESWLPGKNDVALYIRPFVIATEARLGVKISEEYLFTIGCAPVSKYYTKPLKVKVETKYVRAAEGGTGYAKCGGNYGGAFYPAKKALEEGYDQLMWTDAQHNEYIEESGSMNIMFHIDGKLITPALGSSILDGITRASLLQLAKDNGIKTEERKISYRELQQAFEEEKRIEAFGVGTAAVISPIACINIREKEYNSYIGSDALMYRFQKQLEDIRLGRSEDKHGWNYIV